MHMTKKHTLRIYQGVFGCRRTYWQILDIPIKLNPPDRSGGFRFNSANSIT